MNPDGVLAVDKPAGRTSHDVVAAARRALGTRKVGHAGTLDPMATGVLVLGAGRATRLLGYLGGQGKAYEATVVLGASTSTDDAEGETVATASPASLAAVDERAVDAAVAALTGPIAQVPSSVSAVKVDGRRAHALVRAGEEVRLAARPVTVARFAVVARRRSESRIELDVEVECSAGTYVRALARDLGAALGVGGHLARLRRTRSGPFTVADCCPFDAMAPERLIPLAEAARLAFPSTALDEPSAAAVLHGRRVPWPAELPSGEPCALLGPDGSLLAIARDDAGTARYAAVLGAP